MRARSAFISVFGGFREWIRIGLVFVLVLGVIALPQAARSQSASSWQDTTNYNLAVGQTSLPTNVSQSGGAPNGMSDVAVGQGALNSNTTGYYNTALGFYAQYFNTTGYLNTALGTQALFFNTTGSENTAVGYAALIYNTTGSTNMAIGRSALFSNTTGDSNTGVGANALASNVSGAYNVAVGQGAVYSTTSYSNIGVGTAALFRDTTGEGNFGIGYWTGGALTTGNFNDLLGFEVGSNTLATGSHNILVGTDSSTDTPSASTSNFLNIGNAIYATNLQNSGNTGGVASVGIGTTSPGFPLDVNGRVNASGGFCINGNNNCITQWPSGGGSGTVTSVTAGAGLNGGPITTSGSLSLDLTHVNAWTGAQSFGAATTFPGGAWTTAGSLGIGTGSPAGLLHVNSPITSQAQINSQYLQGTTSGLTGSTDNFSLRQTFRATDANYSNLDFAYVEGDVASSSAGSPAGALSFWTKAAGSASPAQAMTIAGTGNVGIGVAPSPTSKLAVSGTVAASEVIVTSTPGADYVFDPGYKLAPLEEVADYIQANHHLPEIPSAKEVQEKGLSLGDMQTKLLAKIEELTLHMIQVQERSDRLERENRDLRERVERIEAAGAR